MWRWIKRTFQGVGIVDTAWSVFTTWKPLVSAAGGIATFAWSVLEGQSMVWATIAGLATFTLVLWAWNGITWRRTVAVQTAAPNKAGTVSSSDEIDLSDLKEVRNRLFRNETVYLDGHKFIGCTFDNCTLSWNGGKFHAENVKFENMIGFATTNELVGGALGVLKWLGMIKSDVTASNIHVPKDKA